MLNKKHRSRHGFLTLSGPLRDRLLKAAREGRLPNPPILTLCPWCDARGVMVVMGRSRGTRPVPILECCRGPAPDGSPTPFTPDGGWRAVETARFMVKSWRAKKPARDAADL